MNTIHPNRALSIEDLEKRRKAAGRLFDKKRTAYFVAKRFGVAISTARDWKKRWKNGTLSAQPQGRKSKLTKKQEKALTTALLEGPEKHGFSTQLWTIERVRKLIRTTQNTAYRPRSVWHLLHRLGFSCQRPERRSKERDEVAIARWKRTRWPALLKKGVA